MGNTILLRDINDKRIDAIITTKNTTAKEIQEIINKVKAEIEDYSCDDIFKELPKDCTVQTLFFGDEIPSVWY